MPGLLGSDKKGDINSFKQLFENPDFKPDMIKIYPVLVIKGTKLFEMWKSGDYEPLDTTSAAKLISLMKEYVPKWVRIQRIQRDVPAPQISSGVLKSNLRQIVVKEMSNHGKKCKCIRCREYGHHSLKEKINFESLQLVFSRINYEASNGVEIFLSIEDKKRDLLIGFLRLRDINISHRYELQNKPCMLIRELKVLGRELSIGQRANMALQHKGFGNDLIKEAERICLEEFNKKQLFVLSGVGVKEYYRNLGFIQDGVYLKKILK
jgi:elongator complex protein 3